MSDEAEIGAARALSFDEDEQTRSSPRCREISPSAPPRPAPFRPVPPSPTPLLLLAYPLFFLLSFLPPYISIFVSFGFSVCLSICLSATHSLILSSRNWSNGSIGGSVRLSLFFDELVRVVVMAIHSPHALPGPQLQKCSPPDECCSCFVRAIPCC